MTSSSTPKLPLILSLFALAISTVALLLALRANATANHARNENPFIENSPARKAAQQRADRTKSMTHARALAQAVLIHAQSNNNQPPAAHNWQQTLLDTDTINPDVLNAPASAASVQTPYHYLEPTPDQIADAYAANAPRIVVIYEDPDLWHGDGGHLVYLDTSTEWIEGDAYRQRIAELLAER